jgi:Nif-specific regulatory protein
MPLFLPPLRERIEDIPDIARHLLAKIGNVQGRKLTIQDGALRRLASHNWPGNVREMENCLERAAILTEEGVIDPDLIRFVQMRERPAARVNPKVGASGTAPAASESASPQTASDEGPDIPLDERGRVIAALEQAGWVQARAARLLGITPRQIAYRIQTLNIEVKQL